MGSISPRHPISELYPSLSSSLTLFALLVSPIFSFSLEPQLHPRIRPGQPRKDFGGRFSLHAILLNHIPLIIRFIGLWVVFNVFLLLFISVIGSFWPVSFPFLSATFIWSLRIFNWFPGLFSLPFRELFFSFTTFSFAWVLQSHFNLQAYHWRRYRYFPYFPKSKFSAVPF